MKIQQSPHKPTETSIPKNTLNKEKERDTFNLKNNNFNALDPLAIYLDRYVFLFCIKMEY